MESPILSHQADDRTLLPSWLLHRTKHQMSTVSNGRLRLVLIASVCITLGYILSTSFATTESHVQGIPSETIDRIKGGNSSKPSLGHALNDLHYAVSDKLSNLLTSSSRSQNTSASNICTSPSTTINSSISEEVLLPDRPALGERLRVAKCTIIFGGSAIYERALQTHEQHDRLHGYPLYVLRHSIMDDVWSKPAYILSLLLRELSKPEEQRLQWLFWVDADTVLLNPSVRIETFLPPSPEFDDVHLVISRDWNGLNNGVFPVRVNQWAVELFAAIVAFRTFRPDEKLTFRDQQAMDLLIKERRFAANIIEAPQRWFNAYPGEEKDMMFPFQVRRGDLLVHFPGMMNRDEIMAKWLDRVEQHLPEWEVDVGHTTYPAEAREFWAQQRELRENTLMTLVDVRNQSMKLVSRVESELGEYRSKITERKATEVLEKMAVLEELLNKEGAVIEELKDAMAELRLAAVPLEQIVTDVIRKLMKEAHDMVFAAERDLVDYAESGEPQSLGTVEEMAGRLKEIALMTSPGRKDLRRAIEDLRGARAYLRQGVASAATVDQKTKDRKKLEAQNQAAEKAKAEMLGKVTAAV